MNDAEIERMVSDAEHQACMNHFKQTEAHVTKLERQLKSNIVKSRKYFETKAVVQSKLEVCIVYFIVVAKVLMDN